VNDRIIIFKNLSYYVRTGFFLRKKIILNNLSFDVRKGSITGLIGPNGAGKTTILKLITGLLKPYLGTLILGDNLIKNIGFVTENQYCYPNMFLEEWLNFMLNLSGRNRFFIKKKVDAILDRFDLFDKKRTLMKNLSKGQLQRAGVVQALLSEPELLILDEPMSGLDAEWRHKLQQFLIDYNRKGNTIIFSSHIMSDILYMSDDLIAINNGQLKWFGKINDISSPDKYFHISSYIKNLNEIKEHFPGIDFKNNKENLYKITLNEAKKDLFLTFSNLNNIKIVSVVPAFIDFKDFEYGK